MNASLFELYRDNTTVGVKNPSATRETPPVSEDLRFWLYLTFLVPSIFCSLFVLYYLLCSIELYGLLSTITP